MKGHCQYGQRCWFSHQDPGGQGRFGPPQSEDTGRSRTPRRLPQHLQRAREPPTLQPRCPSGPPPAARRRRWQREEKEGETYTAVVVSLRDFGAFVRLPNGLEGLVHLSNIGKARINHPKDALTEGQEVNVKVLSVDMPRQRLNLGIRQAQEGTAMSETRVDKARLSAGSSGFGTFAGMLSGVDVAPKKPAAKARPAAPAASAPSVAAPAAKPAEDAPKSGVRRVPPTRR